MSRIHVTGSSPPKSESITTFAPRGSSWFRSLSCTVLFYLQLQHCSQGLSRGSLEKLWERDCLNVGRVRQTSSLKMKCLKFPKFFAFKPNGKTVSGK